MYVDALREYLRACLVCNLSGAEHILGSWGRLSFDGAARGYPTRHRQFLLDRGKDCAGISLVLSQGCASGHLGTAKRYHPQPISLRGFNPTGSDLTGWLAPRAF